MLPQLQVINRSFIKRGARRVCWAPLHLYRILKLVGVMRDERIYDYTVNLHAVITLDFMIVEKIGSPIFFCANLIKILKKSNLGKKSSKKLILFHFSFCS